MLVVSQNYLCVFSATHDCSYGEQMPGCWWAYVGAQSICAAPSVLLIDAQKHSLLQDACLLMVRSLF